MFPRLKNKKFIRKKENIARTIPHDDFPFFGQKKKPKTKLTNKNKAVGVVVL